MRKFDLILPEFYFYKLKSDADRFNLKLNTIYNLIFYKTDLYKVKPIKLIPKDTISKRFNLNKKEQEKYNEFYDNRDKVSKYKSKMKVTDKEASKIVCDYQNTSNLFRAVFINFLEKSATDREIFLFNEIYDKLTKAIKKHKKVRIKYHEKYRVVDPYFITSVENHPFNIVYCYSNAKKFDVTFRLSKIKKIEILKEEINDYDSKKIESEKLNFVLLEERKNNTVLNDKSKASILKEKSYLIDILIKFDKDKSWMFKETSYNKPNNYTEIIDINKLGPKQQKEFKKKYPNFADIKLAENEVLYDINTSIIKVESYFPQFLDYFEILHPESLRNHFKERLTKALKKYK